MMQILIILFLEQASFANSANMEAGVNEVCLTCKKNKIEKITVVESTEVQPQKKEDDFEIETRFYWTTEKTNDKGFIAKAKTIQELGLTADQSLKLNQIFQQSLGRDAKKPMGSFQDSLQFLKSQSAELSTQQKTLLLSMYGSVLAQGYSSKATENRNMESLFQNQLKGQQEGGICGDIHTYLGEVAKSLGYEQVSLHSGLWAQSKDANKAGGHAVVVFQDPKTKKYIGMNYSQIYDLNAKTLQDAVEQSQRMLSANSSTIKIDSGRKYMHVHVPNTARYIQNLVEGVVVGGTQKSDLKVAISNQDKVISGKVNLGPNANAFAFHSNHETAEGPFKVSAIGVSGKVEVRGKLQNNFVDEISAATEMFGGVMQVEAPLFNSYTQSLSESKRQNAFAGVKVAGSARVDDVTGKIVFETKNFDYRSKGGVNGTAGGYSSPETSAILSLEKPVTDQTKLQIARKIEFAPNHIGHGAKMKAQTAYDEVSVIYAKTLNQSQVYIETGGSYYALEGFQNKSAEAVKAHLKSVIPIEKRGEFKIQVSYADIINNKSKDPYYQLPSGVRAAIDYVTPTVIKNVEVGANLTFKKGPQRFPFLDLGPVTPVIPRSDIKELTGGISVSGKF